MKKLVDYYNRTISLRIIIAIIIIPITLIFFIINPNNDVLPKIRKWYAPKYNENRYFFSWNKGKINLRVEHIIIWIILWIIIIF